MSGSSASTNIAISNGINHEIEQTKDVEKQPYVLTELESLAHVQAPLKSTQRIKYVCFAVSKKFLVFGATSGGLYIFKREPCSFLQLIPSKDGALSRVAVSPDERLVAYASSKGLVVLVELQQGSARRLQVSNEHLGSQVTAMQWSTASDELFVGDSLGRVSLCCVSLFSAKNIFQTPSLQLMQLDSAVVQMDCYHELLLISTLSRCYISHTGNEQYKQVGQKLRDGEYGACFLGEAVAEPEPTRDNSEPHGTNHFDLLAAHEHLPTRIRNLRVFCARPGSRLWEVRGDGTVLSTHQFRHALSVHPPAEIISNKPKQERLKTNTQDTMKHSFNFAKLYPIVNKFIFTFKSNGLYIFDPDNAEVVLWNNDFHDIVDAQIVNDTIYVWLASGQMHAITFSLIDKCIMRLYFRKQYALCAQLCSLHTKHLVHKIPTSRKLHFLVDLRDKLLDLGLSELEQKILPLLTELSKVVPEKTRTQKLRSGIYLVGNNHSIESDEEDGKTGLRIFRSLSGSRTRKISERSRSLSSSPRRRKSGAKRQINHELSKQCHSGSLHSLPDISHQTSPAHKPKDTELRQESVQNGRTTNGNSDWHSQYVTYDDMFNVPDLNLSVLTAPETVAALRDLTQILSVKISSGTKSLKKKWHMLEGKVRSLSQDSPPAPLDIKTESYNEVELTSVEAQDSEIVLTPDRSKRASKIKSFPPLDLTTIQDLCTQIKNNESSVNTKELQKQIMIEMNSVCEQFDKCIVDESDKNLHWLQKAAKESFPFKQYFSEEDIAVIRASLLQQLETGDVLQVLDEWLSKVSVTTEHPDVFTKLYTSNDLIMDTLLSRVVTMYSEIFDGERVMTSVLHQHSACLFLTWCAMLSNCQQDVLDFVTSQSRENIRKQIMNQDFPLEKLLNIMYLILRVSSMEGIDICVSIGENVSIKNFCYVLLKLQQNKINSGCSDSAVRLYCHNILLTYLTKLKNNGKQLELECFHDAEVFELMYSAFLSVNNICDVLCSCGFPQLHAIRTAPLQFEYIGNMILTHFQQTENLEAYISLCCKIGLWKKVLENKQERGVKVDDLLPFIIQLDCPRLLEEFTGDLSETLWCELLQMKRSLEVSQLCLQCGSKLATSHSWRLSWTHLGYCLIKALGGMTACDLLLRYMPDNNTLDVEFYQACMFSTIVSPYGETPRKKTVDLLQSQRLEPLQLFSTEVAGAVSEALSRDLVLQGGTSVLPSSVHDHHWGVQTKLRGVQCPRCALPLADPVLLSQGGVRVFPCRHAFHTACLLNTGAYCKLCCPRQE